MTSYKILETDRAGQWTELDGTWEASSAEAAVRNATVEMDRGGDFVAIPARSFKQIRVEFEQVSRRVVKHIEAVKAIKVA